MLAPAKADRSVVEDAEAAARNKRRHVAAGESKRVVRPKGRVGEQMRPVTVRINRIDAQVIGEHRIVRRERRGNQLVDPDPGPRQAAIQAANESGGVTHLRGFQQSGLLHRTADIPQAREFSEIPHAASELLFEGVAAGSWAGAAADKQGHNRNSRQKGDRLAHNDWCYWGQVSPVLRLVKSLLFSCGDASAASDAGAAVELAARFSFHRRPSSFIRVVLSL